MASVMQIHSPAALSLCSLQALYAGLRRLDKRISVGDCPAGRTHPCRVSPPRQTSARLRPGRRRGPIIIDYNDFTCNRGGGQPAGPKRISPARRAAARCPPINRTDPIIFPPTNPSDPVRRLAGKRVGTDRPTNPGASSRRSWVLAFSDESMIIDAPSHSPSID